MSRDHLLVLEDIEKGCAKVVRGLRSASHDFHRSEPESCPRNQERKPEVIAPLR